MLAIQPVWPRMPTELVPDLNRTCTAVAPQLRQNNHPASFPSETECGENPSVFGHRYSGFDDARHNLVGP
jgi:hypothetical protein